MTTFWEAFSDCVIEMDELYNVINLLKKKDSTFTIAGVIGKSFLNTAVDKDRAFVESELELLKAADVPYRRFTFLSKNGRYYRMTLIPERRDGVFIGLRGIAVDVTEHSLKEITLNWQRAIIEGSSDFIYITDMDGHVLYANPGAYRMTGYDPAAGILPLERIFSRKHLRTIFGKGLQRAVLSGFWTCQSELRCADGTMVPIEHSMFSVRNQQDETVFIASIVRNIADLMLHEKTMLLEQQRTELLASVAMSFSLSDDFDANINKALASISRHMNIDAMYIRRDDKEKQCFVTDYLWSDNDEHSANASKDVPTFSAETGEHTREYSILQSAPIFVSNDMSTLEKNIFVRARNAGIRSMICLPIHVDDEFWGYISLSMFSHIRIWTDADIGFLKTICGILSTSLEKRLMAERWQAAQANLQAVVSNYPGVIWSLDSKRRFTLYDGAFLESSGEEAPGIVGQNMHEYAEKNPGLIHPSMLEKVEQTFMGKPQEWMMELKNTVFRCNTMPIQDDNGIITDVVGASADVTGMIRMQKDLEEARKAAEAASVAKSEFLSRMSHEIRTPMNAIIGMTQIAQNSNEEERIKNCLGKIDNASKHLLALINDILDISKIEANKLEIQKGVFSLEKCISSISNIIAVKAEEKKLSFSLNFNESLPKYLEGDELRFTQVIINLLGNAIKFTPENGFVSMDVSERGRENDACILEIKIRDNGIGITDKQQKNLFKPFEQGDGSITREYGGTGLGLAICKSIVELMGGNLWVESEIGKGSIFAFTARMRISGEADYEQIDAAKSGKSAEQNREAAMEGIEDLSGFTVLLAEDVEINREIVYAILEDSRINIDHAENGEKAVEMYTAAPDKYDIILMDLQMPVMDGIEATRRIRAYEEKQPSERPQGIPIVAMTANVFREDVDKCMAAGMNDHIAKPIDSDLLMEKLIHYLILKR